jgi:hypothetical protein
MSLWQHPPVLLPPCSVPYITIHNGIIKPEQDVPQRILKFMNLLRNSNHTAGKIYHGFSGNAV